MQFALLLFILGVKNINFVNVCLQANGLLTKIICGTSVTNSCKTATGFGEIESLHKLTVENYEHEQNGPGSN